MKIDIHNIVCVCLVDKKADGREQSITALLKERIELDLSEQAVTRTL